MWVADGDGPAWLTGGTYLVARRIRMRIEQWDRTTLLEQERVIGRQKGSGAPMGLTDEFEELNFDLVNDKDEPLIDPLAHVRLVSPENLGGIEILRRGYNFTDGSDGFGHLDAGLFFIAFVRNPVTQFVPMQNAISRDDAMNEYVTPTSSAVFACPAWSSRGRHVVVLGLDDLRVTWASRVVGAPKSTFCRRSASKALQNVDFGAKTRRGARRPRR